MRLTEVVWEESSPIRLTSTGELAKIEEKILPVVRWNLKTQEGIELVQIPKIELLAWLGDFNQSKLAAAMGITEGRLSEYLSGKRPIGPTAVRQFAKALGTTPEKLARGKNLSKEELSAELRSRLLDDEEGFVADTPAGIDPTPLPMPPTREQPYGGTVPAGPSREPDGEVIVPEKPKRNKPAK